jgi:hypothetical protein
LNRNGGASPDARQELESLAATEMPPSVKTSAQKSGSARKLSRSRGGRRPRGQVADVRYFVGTPAGDDSKPTLEQEVASEPEALVIAFKNDSRVYFVNEYRVTQKIEGGQVRLEKEPASSAQRVSTANAS